MTHRGRFRITGIRSPFWLTVWTLLYPVMPLLPGPAFWFIVRRAVAFEVTA